MPAARCRIGAVIETAPGTELEVDLGPVRHLEARMIEALADGIRYRGAYITLVGTPAVARTYDTAVRARAELVVA